MSTARFSASVVASYRADVASGERQAAEQGAHRLDDLEQPRHDLDGDVAVVAAPHDADQVRVAGCA